ncbi:MAG TPA: DUF423 domain-containing protein [Pirellulales bacterium]|jgi:uncharacterized membrane protein YgdD (TMEM256/DUF423 family)|nr:DUF423 domain-containing protein [Pirellulales bacterium]
MINAAKIWLLIGSLLAALGVAIGAFGAHALPGWLEARGRSAEDITRALATFETAVRYQMYHALALVLLGLLARQLPDRAWSVAGVLFLVGVAIFSGMLYAWVLTQAKTFAMIVPLGGLAFIAGWLAMAVAAWRASP